MKATLVGLLLALLTSAPPARVERVQSDSTNPSKNVHLVDQAPITVEEVGPGVYLVDFGKVAFGNISIRPPSGRKGTLTVHFGEAMDNGRVHRKPPGTVRYAVVRAELQPGSRQVIAPAADKRNTETESTAHPPAILTPQEWGVVLPFRWVEIEGWPGQLRPEDIRRRAAFATNWDDQAASFECSDPMLNRVWELCHYSIKATTFAGIFVDGDRERIPYEADAYLNQLSYYATSSDNEIPRATFDHLMKYGTWPTEWAYHMVFMAYADWMQTGDKAWLAARYDALTSKLHLDRVQQDGLVHSSPEDIKRTDIVDWPVGERDGYEFGPHNTVVNSFYLRSLRLMSLMGRELERFEDAALYARLERKAYAAFQQELFDREPGLYRDGAASQHRSLHANLFPLAFDLVPENRRETVARWLVERGMKCSVYAAQYLLEGLFENGQSAAALDLMVAPGERSWRHMVESGATITWEAWDHKYKPNQDWNHAWGAAPANLLPRYVLGVQALSPGWKRVRVKPHPGKLTFARGRVPTPQGRLSVEWRQGKTFTLSLKLPKGVSALVELPALPSASEVLVNGKRARAVRKGAFWALTQELDGSVKIELR